MTEPVVLDAEALARLNDQQWRRLGITQTFDRLLVVAAVFTPGPARVIRDQVGSKLSGPALKFWLDSFISLTKDICRRGILSAPRDGELILSEAFGERLRRMLEDVDQGKSHVEPTPGITLEDVHAGMHQREEREKHKKSSRPRAAKKPTSSEPRKKAASEPRKRAATATSSTSSEPESAPAPTPVRVATRPVRRTLPPNKLFTTIKLNRLLDSLDNTTLNKGQLGTRLELVGDDLDRFLGVTSEQAITRVTPEGMVELHWKGRELARTGSADRRLVLIDLVKDLRDGAGPDEE